MQKLYMIIKTEAFSDRPEVLFASTSKTKIDAKLEDIFKELKEDEVFDYVEGDYLILNSDDCYYIESVEKFL